MNTLEGSPAPAPQESLAQYIRRIRTTLGLSQRDLAERAGLHLQSVGKLERGKTAKLNRKTQNGFAQALQLPVEYLEAISRGLAVEPAAVIKFCPPAGFQAHRQNRSGRILAPSTAFNAALPYVVAVASVSLRFSL